MNRKTINESKADLIALWNQEFEKSYPLTDRLINEKIIEPKDVVPEGSYSLYNQEDLVGTIVLKFYQGSDKKSQGNAYVSLIYVNPKYRKTGYGSVLLNDAIRICTENGRTILYIGGDNNCLFSGVFLEDNEFTHRFFKKQRFNIAYKNYNLICKTPPQIEADGYEYSILKTPEELEDLFHLIRKYFPVRWFQDVENCQPEEFLVAKEEGKIIGFVRINYPKFSKLANSTNLYPLYRCLGGIGPVGIAPEKKGLDFGNNMVKQASKVLFDHGCSDIIVDWTNLIDFFKNSGFLDICNQYILYELKLKEKNPEGKVPIYKVIEKELRQDILEGKYKHGDMIPSESELSAKYKVSRMTVLQAINNLLIDGYIYRHKGRGTFVVYSKKEMELEDRPYFSLTSEMKNLKTVVKTSVLAFEIREADEFISMCLQLKLGDLVYYVERLRQVENTPIVFERMYLPLSMYGELNEEIFKGSFYAFAREQLHWTVMNCTQTIESQGVSGRAAELLHLQEGEPSLYVSSTTYLANGRAVVHTRSYFHGNHVHFTHQFSR